jgi:predicted AlkP superfamily pyrophosphatase or phosphodiesterase
MKKHIVLSLAIIILSILYSSSSAQEITRPKLIVGVVVDQMRFDYLYRFLPYYGKGGFRRLMDEGSNFTFAHFNYEATKTAPGHASIYTGTTPYFHGIIGNDWYDRFSKKMINAVADPKYKSVGSIYTGTGASPNRLRTTTITDQLKLASNKKSKVISISFKDRAAVLPGGHLPDGVYWYNTKTGDFITSTYYMNSLPNWVTEFNNKKLSDKYLANGWFLLLSEDKYLISAPDESIAEEDVFNEGKTSFPHTFTKVKYEERYSALGHSPVGNELIAMLAKQALVSENLGKGSWTDFLAISFSSTDIVGHSYGSNSFETQDTYLRLDATIADLLSALDNTLGRGNYFFF